MTTNESPRLTAAREAINNYFDARANVLTRSAALNEARAELAVAESALVEAVPMGRYRISSYIANADHDVLLEIDDVEDTPANAIDVTRLDEIEGAVARAFAAEVTLTEDEGP